MNTTTAQMFGSLAALIAGAAFAHPPDAHGNHSEGQSVHAAHDPSTLRVWTNVRTGEVVRGSFLASHEGSVSIERENSDVVVFALTDLAEPDRAEAERRIAQARAMNLGLAVAAITPAQNAGLPAPKASAAPPQAAPFDLFAPFVKTRWDERWLYVESDGLPHAPVAHPMMTGIKSWQQQVPLPQDYTGRNAWQIPLKPELADKPVSGKTELRRGAIALAVNGVPIFNALNNRGDDAFKAGELDEFGGHSGRADDYHYHIAPLSLQKIVGKDRPIAYALDGYPIFGLFDPAAAAGTGMACPLGSTAKLDEWNGHAAGPDHPGGPYHYHASTEYPYINGGMRGKVTVKDDQIDPQPRATPVRESGRPLRGASITGFKTLGERSWSLEYTLDGKQCAWNYRIEGGKYIFEFVGPDGEKKTETFTKREGGAREGGPGRRGPAPAGGGPGDPPPPPPDGDRPPRREDRPPPREEDLNSPPPPAAAPVTANASQPATKAAASAFTLLSPAVGADGKLPAEFTCDGASVSPPLAWSNPPSGTKCYAITMHHIPGPPRPEDAGRPGEDKHVYLVVYNIPADTLSLAKGDAKIGSRGVNTVNRRAEYAPPCSKGPGSKKYTLTVYALSSEATIAASKDSKGGGVTMDILLAAIKDKTLATATLDVTYERPNRGEQPPARKPAAMSETQKIERMLALLSESDAVFIRNGSEYAGKEAASHLRTKWSAAGKRVSTANEFIDSLASESSASGKPYQIRKKDGSTVPSREWFNQLLATVEAGG